MIEWFRPILTSLALPPVPFVLLALLGAWLGMRARKPRRALGSGLVIVAMVAIWLTNTSGMGRWLEQQWIAPEAALSPAAATALTKPDAAGRVPPTAIVVLGGGRSPPTVETGEATLPPQAMERLQYGVWLSKRTGFDLGFAGGTGWSQATVYDKSEAEVARNIALRDFGVAIKWLEGDSRYTRESAELLMPMLAKDGIERLIVVTTAYHVPRSVRAFEAVAASQAKARSTPSGKNESKPIQIIGAPTGFTVKTGSAWVEWFPSTEGFRECRQVLREWLGYLIGR